MKVLLFTDRYDFWVNSAWKTSLILLLHQNHLKCFHRFQVKYCWHNFIIAQLSKPSTVSSDEFYLTCFEEFSFQCSHFLKLDFKIHNDAYLNAIVILGMTSLQIKLFLSICCSRWLMNQLNWVPSWSDWNTFDREQT